MSKVILIMLLAVVSFGAAAEWVKVGSDGRKNTYYDSSSIRKADNKVKMSHLFELQMIEEVAGKPFRSIEVQAEYDCKELQWRALSSYAYSGNMGNSDVNLGNNDLNSGNRTLNFRTGSSGIVNSVRDPGKWKPVQPDSATEILWKIACEK